MHDSGDRSCDVALCTCGTATRRHLAFDRLSTGERNILQVRTRDWVGGSFTVQGTALVHWYTSSIGHGARGPQRVMQTAEDAYTWAQYGRMKERTANVEMAVWSCQHFVALSADHQVLHQAESHHCVGTNHDCIRHTLSDRLHISSKYR